LTINSPEYPTKKCLKDIDVIQVDQVQSSKSVKQMKVDTELNFYAIKEMSFFGSKDNKNDVNATIIVGRFSIDSIIHPKLLLLRFNSMTVNIHYSYQIKLMNASRLYNLFQPLSGCLEYDVGS
jgi:hypothetical protein